MPSAHYGMRKADEYIATRLPPSGVGLESAVVRECDHVLRLDIIVQQPGSCPVAVAPGRGVKCNWPF
jgi:hypothetical protein